MELVFSTTFFKLKREKTIESSWENRFGISLRNWRKQGETYNNIISSILFCAKHDLPLQGKYDEGSIFTDLLYLQFRVDSGDEVLNNHLKSGAKNALCISHAIKNELI